MVDVTKIAVVVASGTELDGTVDDPTDVEVGSCTNDVDGRDPTVEPGTVTEVFVDETVPAERISWLESPHPATHTETPNTRTTRNTTESRRDGTSLPKDQRIQHLPHSARISHHKQQIR